jgi:hypothetical protein
MCLTLRRAGLAPQIASEGLSRYSNSAKPLMSDLAAQIDSKLGEHGIRLARIESYLYERSLYLLSRTDLNETERNELSLLAQFGFAYPLTS